MSYIGKYIRVFFLLTVYIFLKLGSQIKSTFWQIFLSFEEDAFLARSCTVVVPSFSTRGWEIELCRDLTSK